MIGDKYKFVGDCGIWTVVKEHDTFSELDDGCDVPYRVSHNELNGKYWTKIKEQKLERR